MSTLKRVIAVMASSALAALCANATEPIKINRVAPYASGAATERMQSECDWNATLMQSIVKYGKGQIEMTDQSLDGLSGRTLTVLITRVEAIGGGGWTGPKTGFVKVTQRENGEVVNQYEIGRRTGGRGAMTACGAMQKVAVALGANIAKRAISGKGKVQPPREAG